MSNTNLTSAKKYLPYITLNNNIKIKNPTIADIVAPDTNVMFALLLEHTDTQEVPLFDFFYATFADEQTTSIITKALTYWFIEYNNVFIDGQFLVLSNTITEEKLSLTDEILQEAKSVYKQIFSHSNPDGIAEENIKFKNERQRELWERRKQAQAKLEESRKAHGTTDKGGGLSVGDLIIGLAVLGKFTDEQIMGFTYFFAKDCFAALQRQENFMLQVQTAMFSKEAKLEYWLGK